MSASSEYQKLRSRLAFLRMSAAAEALPGELDHARAAKLTHQGFLERLLAVEVDAVDARRRASLARFASLPSPFTLADFDFAAQPSVDPSLVAELGTPALRGGRHQRLAYDQKRTAAMLDRLLHRSVVLNIDGVKTAL